MCDAVYIPREGARKMAEIKDAQRVLITDDVTGEEAAAFLHEAVHARGVAGVAVVVALTGPLGSGKTTLLSAAGRSWDVGVMRSPTYGYVNSYQCGVGHCVRCRELFTSIAHFDLYRLGSADDFADFGFHEYLVPGALVVMEWPDLMLSFFRAEAARGALVLIEVACRYVDGDLAVRQVILSEC